MAVAHYLSIVIISIASFVFGLIPLTFKKFSTQSCSFFLSLILCLGAGVLLATSIVHMLTEVQEKLKSNAQLYFLPVPSESTPLLSSRDLEHSTKKKINHDCIEQCCHISNITTERPNTSQSCSNSSNLDNTKILCHIDIGKPCSHNLTAKAGLLIALTTHSILEGISIGVQTKFDEIFLVLGSVTLHKVVLSFCLGLELNSINVKKLYSIAAIGIFSIGSSAGILIGLFVTSTSPFNIDAQIQAIAGGSLLYVAAFEVLPRERFQWQHKSRHYAGILQFFFVIIGFTCLSMIHSFVGNYFQITTYKKTNTIIKKVIHLL
ncbi:zinc transporter, putative [Pediculus humanus corporis]|uniref:Zinc transporter, putative n=1 Tax=Pediculus humanus subsp. corporis TaxID=121224 RepID=E0VRA3_PEDHC|nr:zinc transporter, putative [Pediculus humanus corporis]EEB15909.1 zinc transporter, putative [Pediculus humanus corporis]